MIIIYDGAHLADFNDLEICCQGIYSEQIFPIDAVLVRPYSKKYTQEYFYHYVLSCICWIMHDPFCSNRTKWSIYNSIK